MMDNQLIEILTRFIETADFARDEIPVAIEQILRWESIISFAWFCVGLVLLCTATVIAVKIYEDAKRADVHSDDIVLVSVVPVILGFIALAFIGCNIEWIQIYVAPKAFIVDYLRSHT